MKFRKKVAFLLCALIICMCFAGCGASSGNKTIQINAVASEMTLNNVNFYDFFNDVLVSNYSGKSYVPSNGLSSTQIIFLDANGIQRAVCVNTPLQNKPKTVNVYTNAAKTTYDTYTCTY